MEHNHNEPNPIVNFIGLIAQIYLFVDAHVTADEFRAWASFGLGAIVSIMLIIVNYPKVKETLKKKDK